MGSEGKGESQEKVQQDSGEREGLYSLLIWVSQTNTRKIDGPSRIRHGSSRKGGDRGLEKNHKKGFSRTWLKKETERWEGKRLSGGGGKVLPAAIIF